MLGDPIAHSLSPVLHRAAYAELGLDWTYDAHRVPAGGLGVVPRRARRHWRGLSLTMPLKREALPLVDRLTDRARLAGAVNTLVLEDDGTRVGDNTDLPGAAAAIRERTSSPLASAADPGRRRDGHLRRAGAGRPRRDARSTLRVRDAARAEETVAALRAHPAAPDVVVGSLECRRPADRRHRGLDHPRVGADRPSWSSGGPAVPVVFEVLYDPWPTPLAASAGDTGRTLVGGLDLLVHQAALQVELFTGRPAPARRACATPANAPSPARRHEPTVECSS